MNKTWVVSSISFAICFLFLCTATNVVATEIRLLSGSAIIPVMVELIPEFEQSSGYKVTSDLNGTIGGMTDRVLKGEAADVAIVSGAQIDKLQKADKVVAGSRVDLARVGVGVFARKGAAKPDITSVEAFKRTMLAAKSIGWNDPAAGAPVGIYMVGLVERLGIANEMKPKITTFKQRSERFEAVARGDVEIGFNQISEILAAPGVDLVGSLPAEIQSDTLFAAGIVMSGTEKEGGKALIRFLTSPAARGVWTAKGFEMP